MRGLRVLSAVFAATALLWPAPDARSEAGSDFADWAAVVIAADWRSGQGGDTAAFDNARRDVSAALLQAGFLSENLRQYSLRPRRPDDDDAIVTDRVTAVSGFLETAKRARSGCLFYMTSHGQPGAAVFGPGAMITPRMLDVLLDEACPGRPTVVVVSACYSGSFIPEVRASNRMILTASRADRNSFGCSDRDRYPYFDACMIEAIPRSRDFLAAATRARACVARMEAERLLAPPSEPQMSVGADLQARLPMLQFAGP